MGIQYNLYTYIYIYHSTLNSFTSTGLSFLAKFHCCTRLSFGGLPPLGCILTVSGGRQKVRYHLPLGKTCFEDESPMRRLSLVEGYLTFGFHPSKFYTKISPPHDSSKSSTFEVPASLKHKWRWGPGSRGSRLRGESRVMNGTLGAADGRVWRECSSTRHSRGRRLWA